MSMIVWGLAAVMAGVLVTILGAALLRGERTAALPLDERLPPTPLQRLARRGLVAGALVAGGLVVLLARFGPERAMEDAPVRVAFMLLLMALLLVLGFLTWRLASWARRADDPLDERDRQILNGANFLQSASILTTLAIWVIGLQESFWALREVPLYYLQLLFWSCVVVSLLAFPLGILLGYRRY